MYGGYMFQVSYEFLVFVPYFSRCCYLARQREKMLAVHDEILSMPEGTK